MKIVFYILVFLSGVLGSMGMGGGTLLIPTLLFFGGASQLVAQKINLFVFLPLAIVSVILHAKNKLINFKPAFLCSIFACVGSFTTAFFAQKIKGKVLSIILGCFLIVVGIFYLICQFKLDKEKKFVLKKLS